MAPAVASGSTVSLVAWQDWRNDNLDIYAARVRADGTVLDRGGLAVAEEMHDEWHPCVTAEADGFGVLWSRWEYSDSTVFASARVGLGGNVGQSGDWFAIPGYGVGYDATYGSGPELLLLFSCFTDTALGRRYGVERLWGRFGDVTGVRQADSRQTRSARGGGTVVRGVLNLEAYGRQHTAYRAELLDVSGRRVLDLHPGANDVSRLAPGVYFVRAVAHESSVGGCRKVVIAR